MNSRIIEADGISIHSESFGSPADPAIIDYHQHAGELDWTDREAVVAYQVGAWRRPF